MCSGTRPTSPPQSSESKFSAFAQSERNSFRRLAPTFDGRAPKRSRHRFPASHGRDEIQPIHFGQTMQFRMAAELSDAAANLTLSGERNLATRSFSEVT